MRCVHESKLHDQNCFITLTYDDANLPEDGGLVLRHFQEFMRSLRKRTGQKIRFYHCGEYGEECKKCGLSRRYCLCYYFDKAIGRPHYHSCIFSYDFEDKVPFKKIGDNQLYVSKQLQETWKKGFATVGNLTFKSAAYVARYITKKVNGSMAESHYEKVNRKTGEVIAVRPEYTTMSRRPGIGSKFFNEFKTEIYPDDFIIMNGRKMKPPKYYDRQFELANEEVYKNVKKERLKTAYEQRDNNTPERLKVREKCAIAQKNLSKRTLEES